MTRREQGFTLIEMLIALVVLALAMAAVNEGLRFASRSLSAASDRTENINSRAMGSNVVRRLVEDTYPLVVLPTDADNPQLLFEGAEDRLKTAAFLPGYVSESGLYALVFEIERDGKGSVLTLSRDLVSRLDDPIRWPRAADGTVILRSEGRLRWAYLAGDSAEGDGDWDEALTLPAGVQLIEEYQGERVLFTATLPVQASWPCSTEALLFCPLDEVFR